MFLGFQFLNTLFMSTFSVLTSGVTVFFDFCAVASTVDKIEATKSEEIKIIRM
jgi:hypothetical protein